MATPLRLSLLLAPFVALIVLWLVGQGGLGAQIITLAEQLRLWFSTLFAWVFLATAFVAILAVCGACAAHGDLRIGGPNEKRRMSDFEAVAVGFAACTSMGLLFWSAAEPLFHAYDPPLAMKHAANSRGAQTLALAAGVFHWAVLAQAIFGVFMVAFAIAVQTIGYTSSLDGVVFGSRPDRARWGFSVLDGLAVFFATLLLVGGLASAVGPIMRWGFGDMLPPDLALGIGVVIAMLLILLCGARPPATSYGSLAKVSLILLLGILVACFFLGPIGKILGGGLKAMLWTVTNSPKLMFGGFAEYRDGWPVAWTVTHLAGWMIFAPLIGFFLSRAARGFRLDDAVIYFIMCPALIVMLVVLIFGGLSLATDQSTRGAVWQILDREGPGVAIYFILDKLRGGYVLTLALTAATVMAFVGFAAAALHATMRIVAPGVDDAPSVVANRRGAIFLWIFLFGITSWLVAAFGLGSLVEAVGRLGGLPALLLSVLVVVSVLRFCFVPTSKLKPLHIEGPDMKRYEPAGQKFRVEDGDELAYEEAVRKGKPRSEK